MSCNETIFKLALNKEVVQLFFDRIVCSDCGFYEFTDDFGIKKNYYYMYGKILEVNDRFLIFQERDKKSKFIINFRFHLLS